MTAILTVSPRHPTANVEIPADQLDDYERWQAARATGITATDTRKLTGHGYEGETVTGVFLSKVEPQLEQDDMDTPRAWDLGNAEEPVIAHFAEIDLRVSLARVGLLRHKEHRHLLSSPDRNCSCGGHAELKDTNSWYLRNYQDDTSEWTNEDGWTLPPAWRVQTRHQLLVSGRDHVHVCAKIADRKVFTYWLVEEDRREQDLIHALADTMWEHVVAGVMPPLSWDTVTAAEVKARYPKAVEAKIVVLDDQGTYQVRQLLTERAVLKAEGKSNEDQLDRVETLLKMIAGDAEVVLADDGKTQLFKYSNRSRSNTDTKRLFKDHPELAAVYTKTSTHRAFSGIKAGA